MKQCIFLALFCMSLIACSSDDDASSDTNNGDTVRVEFTRNGIPGFKVTTWNQRKAAVSQDANHGELVGEDFIPVEACGPDNF